MNSAQRRKSKRGHPHIITIHTKVQATYREHDEKVYQAVGWCKKNCKGVWKCDTGWDHADFKFSEQKDAVYFALKWA
jgi:hypothetical protein